MKLQYKAEAAPALIALGIQPYTDHRGTTSDGTMSVTK